MFRQILATVGQEDDKGYQVKTVILGTVKQRKEIEFSQTTGKPGQSFVLIAENGEESWVKWIGKDVEKGAMPEECVGNQYEWIVWPFKADQAKKPSLYCWLSTLVKPKDQNPQQGNPKGQQATNAKPADEPVDWDGKQQREFRSHAIHSATLLVVALAEVNEESRGMSPELVVQMAETYVKYVYNGREAVPNREPAPDGGYGLPPVGDDDIPF